MCDNDKETQPEERRLNEENQNGGKSNYSAKTMKRGKCGEPTWTDTLYQVLASCIVHCMVIQAGVNMVYSTVLTRGLQIDNNINNNSNDTNFHNENRMIIDKDNESWIASLVTITLPIGALTAGPLMDKFGRKTICLLVCVPVMISWFLLIISKSLAMIYAARIIAGIAAGLSTVGLVYVNEITHPRVRPMLLCMNSVFASLGILLVGIFALWLDWRRIAMVFLGLNGAIFFAIFAVPESPYWLVCFAGGFDDERRIVRAEKCLRWLNRRSLMYDQEWNRIKEMTQNRHENSSKSSPPTSLFKRAKRYMKDFRRPTVYKPMFLLVAILLCQQLSGAYVVIFYAISVFRKIGGEGNAHFDEYGALLLLGVIRFVMSTLTAGLSRRIGRRGLCMASGVGMTFAMFFSAMLIYLTSDGNENADASMAHRPWMLLVVVLFYVCMSTLGFVVIPWTLIGELLPIDFRGVGGGIVMSFAYVAMFAVVKIYPFALDALGPQNIFFFFSFASLMGTAVVYLFLPETLGKSFKEIGEFFDPKDETEER